MATKHVVALFVLVGGCGGAEAGEPVEANEMAEQGDEGPPPDGPDGPRGHGPRMLKEALAEIEMTDEQRGRIEALLAPPENRREERRARHEAVVAAVRSGNQADLRRVVEEADRGDEHRQHLVTVLNGIHATLNPDQRRALVAEIRSRMEEHQDFDGGRGARGVRHGRGGPRERILADLGLTDEQRQRLDAARREAGLERPSRDEREERHDAMRAHVEEMLTAFERDDFDASRLTRPPDHEGPMARHGKELVVLVPILTPEQREKLADQMERHHGRQGR